MTLTPMERALEWLPANDDIDRPQVTLSTVAPDGGPDARTVLLSSAGPEGVYFHTDAHSRKVRELLDDPRAVMTVLWPGFTRQLVIRGVAELAGVDELASAYRARSPYLQQLAWQNTREFAAQPLRDRVEQWAEFAARHPLGFEQPDNWTGFLIRPDRLSFWTSNADAASQRLEYTLGERGWLLEYLPG
ncbi:MAG: pyridoxamine 5'-phosphate oxidase family protein [Burkholderiaceae bacterium]|nr:pyridoxamine 5'-phosphate oxidase family protein [Microbacteriaceae bacterium]